MTFAERGDDTIAPKSCQGEEACRYAYFQTVSIASVCMSFSDDFVRQLKV